MKSHKELQKELRDATDQFLAEGGQITKLPITARNPDCYKRLSMNDRNKTIRAANGLSRA